jgi:hypothetical protein
MYLLNFCQNWFVDLLGSHYSVYRKNIVVYFFV